MSHAPKVTLRSPREHGFWVLLAITVAAPVLDRPSLRSAFAAVAVAAATVVVAALVGKRIRKNPTLQVGAAVGFGVCAVVIELAGGAPFAHAVGMGAGLGAAFVAGAACVRAVLERQRRRREQAARWSVCSLLVPLATAVLLTVTWGWLAAGALAITTAYALGLIVLSPSAHRLRQIGLSLTAAHVATALLLVAG